MTRKATYLGIRYDKGRIGERKKCVVGYLEGVTGLASHKLERALKNGTRVAKGLFLLRVIHHHYVQYLPHLAHRTCRLFIHSKQNQNKRQPKTNVSDIYAIGPTRKELNSNAKEKNRGGDNNDNVDETIQGY